MSFSSPGSVLAALTTEIVWYIDAENVVDPGLVSFCAAKLMEAHEPKKASEALEDPFFVVSCGLRESYVVETAALAKTRN